MRCSIFKIKAELIFFLFLLISGIVHGQALITETFNFTGATQTFVIPPCTGNLTVFINGAQGASGLTANGFGGNAPGVGGRVTAVLTPTPGVSLYINIGGVGSAPTGGFNGGGSGGTGSTTAGGGGGASDIRMNGQAFSDRIVVAGGGGGGAGASGIPAYGGDAGGGAGFTGTTCLSPYGGVGVNGGQLSGIGCAGGTVTSYGGGGGGGGLTSGGGVTGSGIGSFGQAGSLGMGGNGGGAVPVYGGTGTGINGGGGGGGGYYGGAGGMSGGISTVQPLNGGGGGGSTYCNPVLFSNISFYYNSQYGFCTITYTAPITASASSPIICSGSQVTLSVNGASSGYTWQPTGNFAGSNNASVIVTPSVSTNYSVSLTTSLGCIAQTVVPVSVANGVPILSITSVPGPSVCPGKTLSLNASGATTYTWSGSIINGNSFIPTSVAIYTVTGSNVCGNSSATTSVGFYPSPTITASADKSVVCSGNPVVLNGGGALSYTWSSGVTDNVSFVPTATGIYTVTGSSANSCTASAVVGVTVIVSPTVSPVSSATAICVGNTVTLSAVGATGYTWSPGLNPNSAIIIVSPLSTIIYTLNRNNNGCTSSNTINVVVNPVPSLTAGVSSSTFCAGLPVTFSASGAASYTWTGGVSNNIPYAPGASGNYTVTGAHVNGCTSTAVVGVTVLITPTITPVATATAICFGSTATLSAGGATGFTWTPGIALNTQSIAVSPPISTTYTLFRTNGPCSGTNTVNLIVNPIPAVNASANPTLICAGSSASLLASGTLSYTWLPGSSTFSTNVVSPTVSTDYTVTGSNGNCTMAAVVSISVNPSPTITIAAASTSICQGSSLTFTGGGGVTYTWLPTNSNNQVEVFSPSVTTTYTLTGTNALGCATSQTRAITVNPVPNLTITSDVNFLCAGQPAVLSVVSPSSIVVYNWSTGPSGSSITVSPTVTTNYVVVASNTITGCQNTNTFTLPAYTATFAVTGPTAICIGQTVTLVASGPATSYSWSTSGGVVTPSVLISSTITTGYSVLGTNGPCSSSKNFSVIVHPLPNVTAVTAISTICKSEVSTISGNGASSYSWSTGATTPSISVSLGVTTTYTLSGTDLNGCSKTVTATQFVVACTAIENISANGDQGLNIFPNPNNGEFSVVSDFKIDLKIINDLGEVVKRLEINEKNRQIFVQDLSPGIYFVLGQKDNLNFCRKIIITE